VNFWRFMDRNGGDYLFWTVLLVLGLGACGASAGGEGCRVSVGLDGVQVSPVDGGAK